MRLTRIFTIGLATLFAIITSFIKRDSPVSYGFVSKVAIVNSQLYHYTVVDLAKLDEVDALYECEIASGTFCTIKLDLGSTVVTRSGSCNSEIMEFDFNPSAVQQEGENNRFVYECY